MTAVAAEPAISPDERVERNMRLARSVANRYARHLPFPRDEDGMFGECLLGLLSAARRFDPDRGFAFSTYAVPAMRRRAKNFIKAERRRGFWIQGKPADMKQPEVYTEGDYRGASPVHKAIAPAPRLRWTPEEWAAVLRPLGERTRAVVLARFAEGLSLDRIGERVGCSYQRVGQIIERALKALRHAHPHLANEL